MSVLGIILSLVAILGGQVLEGGHIQSLANGPAMLIVFGGTLGAVLVQTPFSVFFDAIRRLPWIFIPPRLSFDYALKSVEEWADAARRNGLLSLDQFADSERDPFAQKGLRLLVDGNEPESIRAILEVEIASKEAVGVRVAKFYEGMGGYAPTIGIIGAVMGLIHVMENLSDPSKLGSGIAAAFVATIYGVASANLLYLPVANKLKNITERQTRHSEMLTEGVIAIAEGVNPRNVRVKLEGYLP